MSFNGILEAIRGKRKAKYESTRTQLDEMTLALARGEEVDLDELEIALETIGMSDLDFKVLLENKKVRLDLLEQKKAIEPLAKQDQAAEAELERVQREFATVQAEWQAKIATAAQKRSDASQARINLNIVLQRLRETWVDEDGELDAFNEQASVLIEQIAVIDEELKMLRYQESSAKIDLEAEPGYTPIRDEVATRRAREHESKLERWQVAKQKLDAAENEKRAIVEQLAQVRNEQAKVSERALVEP